MAGAMLATPLSGGPVHAADPKTLTFFRIGTGPTAETLYGLGTAISAGISRPPGSSPCNEGGVCGVPGLIAVAQSRNGSIPNIRDIRDGELESALVHADMAYWAYHDGGPFADGAGVPDLRVIANLIPVVMHIVVRANSDIHTISDLRDKVVSLGAQGAGTARFVDSLMRFHGLTVKDVHPLYLQPGLAADYLISGEIDAFFDMGAAPVDAIDELNDEEDIRLIPVPQDVTDRLRSLYPFLTQGEIPAETYRGVGATPSISLGVQWVVRESVDTQLVEAITRALWQSDTANLFNQNNPGHRFPTIDLGRQPGLVPFHDGALAYYDSLPGTG